MSKHTNTFLNKIHFALLDNVTANTHNGTATWLLQFTTGLTMNVSQQTFAAIKMWLNLVMIRRTDYPLSFVDFELIAMPPTGMTFEMYSYRMSKIHQHLRLLGNTVTDMPTIHDEKNETFYFDPLQFQFRLRSSKKDKRVYLDTIKYIKQAHGQVAGSGNPLGVGNSINRNGFHL